MSRTVKVSELSILSRKLMVAKILEKRDKVAQGGKLSANSALMAWQSSAPMRTGRMRGSLRIDSNKSTANLVPIDSYMKVINSVNKRGKHKGFLDTFRKTQGNSFLKKF